MFYHDHKNDKTVFASPLLKVSAAWCQLTFITLVYVAFSFGHASNKYCKPLLYTLNNIWCIEWYLTALSGLKRGSMITVPFENFRKKAKLSEMNAKFSLWKKTCRWTWSRISAITLPFCAHFICLVWGHKIKALDTTDMKYTSSIYPRWRFLNMVSQCYKRYFLL